MILWKEIINIGRWKNDSIDRDHTCGWKWGSTQELQRGEKSPDSTLELTEEWFSSRNKELAQLKETPYKVF